VLFRLHVRGNRLDLNRRQILDDAVHHVAPSEPATGCNSAASRRTSRAVRESLKGKPLVSEGFTFSPLKARHGLDYALANTPDIDGGKLSGRLVGDIIDGAVKAQTFAPLGRALAGESARRRERPADVRTQTSESPTAPRQSYAPPQPTRWTTASWTPR
jgi:hypothetical protein